MDSGEQGQQRHQDEEAVKGPHHGTQPPAGRPQRVEEERVQKREPPPVYEVHREPVDRGQVTVRGEQGAEDERDVHPGQAQRGAEPEGGG